MLTYLFQKNQLKGLYIFSSIILEPGISAATISERLSISEATVKRTITILTTELAETFPEQEVLLEEYGHYTLSPQFNSNKFKPIIKLSNAYLSESSAANLLKLVVTHSEINIVTLSHQLHLSQSYCYALIKQVNRGLQKYEIEMVMTNNMVTLVGDDIRLIFLTYYFNKWQYELDEALLTQFLHRHVDHKPYTNIDDSEHRLAIFKEAIISQGRPQQFSKYYDSQLDELYTVIQENQEYFPDIPAPEVPAGQRLKNAVTAITRLWIVRIDSIEEQIALAETMMALDNPITELSQNLISSFIYRFNLESIQKDPSIYALLFFHLTINLMYIQQFRIDFSKMFYPSVTEIFKHRIADVPTAEYTLIRQFVKQVPIKSPIWDLASTSHFQDTIYRIFYAALDYSYRSKISIFVDMSASIDGLLLFKQKLSQLFTQDVFYYTDSPLTADIVFIDRAKQIKTSGDIYLVYNLTTNQKWLDVFQFVMQVYFEKLDTHANQTVNDYFV